MIGARDDVWGVSLHQPWAAAIAAGLKTYETRGRAAPQHHVGTRIFIHAALKRPVDGMHVGRDWRYCRAFDRPDRPDRVDFLQHFASGEPGAPDDVPCPRGAVVATAVLAECLPMLDHNPLGSSPRPFVLLMGGRAPYVRRHSPFSIEELPNEAAWGEWAPGRFAWRLTDVEALSEPVPVKGQQGLFRVPARALR